MHALSIGTFLTILCSVVIAAEPGIRPRTDAPPLGRETAEALDRGHEIVDFIVAHYKHPEASVTYPTFYYSAGSLSTHVDIYGVTTAEEQYRIVATVRAEFPKHQWKIIYLKFLDPEGPIDVKKRDGPKILYSVVIK